jgi:BirA family biotin operon repressor/biotin-[acetyl-CoA-carboxylase] ligase
MKHDFPVVGDPFIPLREVDSTNNYAMARIAEGPVTEGTTWFAWRQTSGRGQRGKRWQSEAGENVMLSVVLKPLTLSISDQFMLSASVALALRDLVRTYTTRPVTIKWSNDIYIDDKKAGGILIENVLRGNRWTHAVVGIGLNVNQVTFPPELPNPGSLAMASEQRYDVLEVAGKLCRSLERRYSELVPARFDAVLSEYTASLYRLGETQRFSGPQEIFEATILGVEKDGKLLLDREGALLKMDFGEVSFLVGPPGSPVS